MAVFVHVHNESGMLPLRVKDRTVFCNVPQATYSVFSIVQLSGCFIL